MGLFKKIKNKLGMLALFGLLFQLTMPIYETYVFAQGENIEETMTTTGTVEENSDSDGEGFTEDEDSKVADADADAGVIIETDSETEELEIIEDMKEDKNKEQTEQLENTEDESELTDEKEENTEDTESVSTESVPEELNLEPEVNREPEEITANILKSMRLMYKDGTVFEEDDLIEIDEDLRFELDWELPNDHGYMSGDYFEFKLPRQLTVYNSLDGPLGDYGTYTVDMNGNVRFTFNEKIEEESDIKGTFWFDTELDESTITSTEETIDLVINGIIVETVNVNVRPTSGQAISKEGQPVDGNFNTEEVEWTVIVNTTRESLKNAIINDPILAGQELILDSIKLQEVEVDLAGDVVKELVEVTGFTKNSTKENLNIELGDTNKAYKLTFKTKLLEKDFKEGTINYKNDAILTSDGKDDAQAGGSVSVSRPKSMEKTSSPFDKEDRSIEWTVNANFTEQNLKKDDVITDEFTFTVGDEEFTGVFEIKEENIEILQVDSFDASGNPVETSNAKNLFEITIDGNKVTYKLKEDSNKAFILKYKTELKDGAYINKDGKITNKIELNGNTATGSQGVFQQVGKKSNAGINYEDKTIDWKITVNADNQDLRNFVLTDSFAGTGQKLVEDTIKIEPADNGATITPNQDLEGFEIDFGDITEKYVITYQTKFTYDFDGTERPNFKNGVNITYETSDGTEYELEFGNTIPPNKETKSNGAKNGTVNQKNKEITWKVDINYNQLALTDAKVKDEIPDNQLLIDGSVKIYETSIAKNGSIKVGIDVTDQFTMDASENQVNVDFGAIDKSYRVDFKTRDKDGIYNKGEVYENIAQFIPREGEKHNLKANVTLPNQGEFLGKTGTHNKEDWTIDWKIDVNKSLSTTSDFTITDDLGDPTAQILLEDTIKVTKVGSPDELVEGGDYKLTVNGNKFEIYIPGEVSEAYEITYSSYILTEETLDLTNEAQIQSNNVILGNTEKIETIKVKISTGGGTGEGTTGGLEIQKSEADTNRPLPDVAFQLIKKVGNKEIVVREGTTGDNGKLKWVGLQFGDYTLIEVVPEGYTGEESQTVTILKDNPEGIKTLPIENDREKGTLRIIKVDSSTNELLEGAEFTLINQITKQEYTFKTDDDGVILEEIPFGEYSVQEITAPDGYRITKDIENITVEIDKTTTVEVKNVAYVDIAVQKGWYVDEGKKLPESITVNLLRNGQVTNQSVTLDAANKWKNSFNNLDKYSKTNKEIKYTIEEVEVDGYITEKDGYNLINIQSTDVSGQKIWLDDNNPERPASIKIHLLANGEKTNHSLEVSGKTDWEYRFTDIPKYDKAGEEIEYSVIEEAIKGYKTLIEDFIVTNLRVGKTEVSGEKHWEDAGPADRPESIEVILTRNVKGELDKDFKQQHTVTPDSDGKWVYTFDTLPEFDEEGRVYTYTVKEAIEPAGYESSVEGYDITNLRVGTVTLSGTKTWKDNQGTSRPDSITVNLLRNNSVVDTKVVQPADSADEWSYTFTDLPEFDEKGIAYVYSVSEEDVPGYSAEFSGMDITNTRSEKKTIEITKGWLDDHSKDRPKSIKVDLYQNDQFFKTVKVKASEAWVYEFDDLEAYDENGKAYTYSIREQEVKGYESTISGFNITNLRVGKIEINGEKMWKDDGATERPDSIEVILTRELKGVIDDEFVTIQRVTPNATGKWTYTFANLPEYDENGVAYDYKISEAVTQGYESSVNGYDLTNVRVGLTEVHVNKNWVNDQKETRPKSIEVDLLQNEKVLKSVMLSEIDGWAYTFSNLAAFDQEGKAYKYTIQEKPVKGYEISLEETGTGFELTNTYIAPEIPVKPDKPGKPGKPGKLGKPQESKKPEESDKTEKSDLPKTGETSNTGLYLMGGLFILVGLVLGKKRIEE